MDINKFYVAGINYKKAEAELRSLFAINHQQYALILSEASNIGLNELFVLSTCNRTEIYGFANDVNDLVNLLCKHCNGNANTFKQSAYIKNGNDAVEHIFNVGAGLDSQILGDYEIVGQLKTAVKFAKEYNCIGAYTERLVNAVLQASKLIKANTHLSSGTVSVAFSAVQYIKANVKHISDKKILLLGTGKIGSNTCKNLVDYLNTTNITLINRSFNKAHELANELGLKAASISNLQSEINEADVILVATNAAVPVILQSHLVSNKKEKHIIDLSIPCNVEDSVRRMNNICLINVDELSQLKDKTLNKRKAEVPKAKAIIAAIIEEFYEWYKMRSNVPMLKALKVTLKEIHSSTFSTTVETLAAVDVKIQKVLNETAGKIKTENLKGCFYIKAINDFIRAS